MRDEDEERPDATFRFALAVVAASSAIFASASHVMKRATSRLAKGGRRPGGSTRRMAPFVCAHGAW
jgi:hypothetical protein